MLSNTVNKTSLHPGGVQPAAIDHHTEIEEALHEQAHIDYDRVAIVSQPHTDIEPLSITNPQQIANPSVAALYEDALVGLPALFSPTAG